MRVTEIMTKPVYSCRPQDRLNAAAQIMWEHDCGIVPVVDETGHLKGVITDRDICMAAYFQNRALTDIQISGVMTRELCTTRPEDDVFAAEHAMAEHQVHRLPVCDNDGVLIGMLSLADVARTTKTDGRAKTSAATEELARTVSAIREPHRPEAAGSRTH